MKKSHIILVAFFSVFLLTSCGGGGGDGRGRYQVQLNRDGNAVMLDTQTGELWRGVRENNYRYWKSRTILPKKK